MKIMSMLSIHPYSTDYSSGFIALGALNLGFEVEVF